MSVSKPKRASFRIDDILSLKSAANDVSSISGQESSKCPHHQISDENLNKSADARLIFPTNDFLIHQANSHSSLLQEIGNRKRKRDAFERTLSEQSDSLFQSRSCDTLKTIDTDCENQRKHCIETDTFSTFDNKDKLYPITPKATKLPMSLESLMRTHTHDYLLKLPSFSPWTVLTNHCLSLLPPVLDLPSPPTLVESTKCLCGSTSCTSHRANILAGSDGPASFLRPAHSPSSTNCITQDAPSIPIPLPVYVRTRDVTGIDSGNKPKKCRRSRTVFTELQLMGLEKKFESQKYLSTPDRLDIADRLGLTQLQVKTWYQNRRMKWKKQVLQKGGTEAPTKPKGRPRKDSTYAESGSSCGSPAPNVSDSDVELSDV